MPCTLTGSAHINYYTSRPKILIANWYMHIAYQRVGQHGVSYVMATTPWWQLPYTSAQVAYWYSQQPSSVLANPMWLWLGGSLQQFQFWLWRIHRVNLSFAIVIKYFTIKKYNKSTHLMYALKPCWGHIEDPCSKVPTIRWGTKESILPPSPLIIVKWIDHVIQRLSEGNCTRIEIILPSPFWVSHNNLNER